MLFVVAYDVFNASEGANEDKGVNIMSKLYTVKGYEGKDGKGDKIVVAHVYNAWNEDNGYSVWVQRENYSAGKMVKTWRIMSSDNMTKEAAIEFFNKRNKAK